MESSTVVRSNLCEIARCAERSATAADVAVLLVSYNTKRHLEACLHSLLDAQVQLRQQVIVVDNASTDGSVEMIHRTFPTVDVITSKTNLGFGAAVNLAATLADAEFLLL